MRSFGVQPFVLLLHSRVDRLELLTGDGVTTLYLVDAHGRKLCCQRCGKLIVGSVPCGVSQREALMRQQERRTSRRGMIPATVRVMKRIAVSLGRDRTDGRGRASS
jgi:hypothetical protein